MHNPWELKGALPYLEEKCVREDQTVSQMAEQVLTRQAKALAQRSGQPFEDARRVVSDTEAGRKLRVLANGEHGQEKAKVWQARVLWERAEERFMRRIGSEILSRIVSERLPTRNRGATHRC
jgi:hypothetical protein